MRKVEGDLAIERDAERLRCFTDKIGLSYVGIERSENFNADFLGFASRDPENVGKASERTRRGVGVGGFGVVDEANLADPCHVFHAVWQTGKTGDRFCDQAGVARERLGRRERERGVLMIVRSWKMGGGRQFQDPRCALSERVIEPAIHHENAATEHLAHRDGNCGRSTV